MSETTYDLMVTPTPGACRAYVWIGQSFKYCDRCSLPYWVHSHESRLRQRDDDHGPFSRNQGERRKVITRVHAERTRRAWEGRDY